MVFNFTIRGGPCLNAHSHVVLTSSDIICYVGRDKHENEYLIKYGWPGDIWFHVDSLSSAHVYFRLVSSDAAHIPVTSIPIDNLPVDSVYDMMQIVKHNSISGSKLASTRIVYTPHSNLKKTFEMESGSVTYHDTTLCRYARCDKDRQRIKDLEKTKTERVNVNFYEEMKGNERRIIERKKRERLSSNAGDTELYDPIRDDRRTSKLRATRQGDEETGLDKALEALEGISFALAPVPSTTAHATSDNQDETMTDEEVEDDRPVWMKEENDRLHESSPNLGFLRERGYTSQDSTVALKRCGGNRMLALQSIWQQAEAAASDDTTTAAEAAEARLEEKEVLMAIFGEDDGATFSADEDMFDTILPITSYEPPARYESPPALLLEVYADNDMAPQYPISSPPVLAIVGGGLPETLLKELTDRLRVETWTRCKEEPGDPQIFTLLSFAAEEAEKLIEEETVKLEIERKERLKEQAEKDRIAARERKSDKPSGPSAATAVFKNEQERRAYAMGVMGSVKVTEAKKKEPVVKRYNTGVSDQSLIDDLFGV
jgi:hypothetical protein